jgi:hypothetical protein
MTPLGFMYADVVFDKALEIDPKNDRARFYKAFLKPVMSLRGSLARVKPLVDLSDSATRTNYKKTIDEIPNSGLRTFLLDGPADIVDEKSAQDFLAQYRNELNEYRLFLRENKGLKLTLNLSELSWQGRIDEVVKECPVQEVSYGTYEIINCDFSKVLQVDVSRADIEIMQQIVAGYQLYSIMYTTYDATGLINLSSAQPLTQKQAVLFLKSNSDFGKLRKDHQLETVLSMGSDVVAGVRWALTIQNELCPNGSANPKNRPGLLFREGICVKSRTDDGRSVQEILRTVESAIAGQSTPNVFIGRGINEGQTYDSVVNIAAPLKNPVQDLKSMMPTKFDQCGNATDVGDNTLGGLFPQGDAKTILTLQQEINKPCYPWQM